MGGIPARGESVLGEGKEVDIKEGEVQCSREPQITRIHRKVKTRGLK